jgi:hypothetical protein
LQPSLFDDRDMAEITSPDYPGERLVVCKNPLLAAERAVPKVRIHLSPAESHQTVGSAHDFRQGPSISTARFRASSAAAALRKNRPFSVKFKQAFLHENPLLESRIMRSAASGGVSKARTSKIAPA